MSLDPQKVESLFDRVLQRRPEQRAEFLAGACGGDSALRERVEELLRASEAETGFLPAGGAVETAPPEIRQIKLTEEAGSRIDRYKLLEKLGEGGFGIVWAADQKEPVRRRVALKIIKLGMDTEQVVARFEAERQALALMDHPNIAKVLDAGKTETGRPYFVMELVKGMPITKYCDQEKMDTKARLELFIKVCLAIQHAHQKGIIHRDIKPSNVMVTLHDGIPVPKVIDFGIAKATQADLTDKTVYTQYSQFIGTPAYMSPEQAEMSGLDIDTRADIYSLGVLLYELLTGSTPFDTKDLINSGLDEMRKIIREQEPVRPSTRLSQTLEAAGSTGERVLHPTTLPSDLDWIVMKCLEKDRARRYETANSISADVRRHLDNEEILARPPSTLYRLQKTWRRNRLKFSAAVAVAAAMIIGTGVSLWQANEARQARRAEQEQTVAALQSADQARVAEAGETRLRLAAERQKAVTRTQAYAADMLLAQQSLKANNLRSARRLLDRNRPAEGEEDLRGWEWRHLWLRCRPQSRIRLQVSGQPSTAAYSADGKHLVCLLVGKDSGGKVSYWNPAAGREETVLQDAGAFKAPHHSSSMLTLSLDRQWIAAVSRSEAKESLVRIWDAEKKALVAELKVGTGIPYSLALSRTNRSLAVSMWDGSASLWRFSSPTSTNRLTLFGNDDGLLKAGTLCYSPDGRRLAVGLSRAKPNGNSDAEIRLLDAETGTISSMIRTTMDGRVRALAFSPDGRYLAAGCAFIDSRITVWDAQRKALITLSGHHGFIGGLAFSPDGRYLASASGDQTVKLWNTGNWVEESTLLAHTEEVRAVDFSPDGSQLATIGKDAQLHVWDLRRSPKNKPSLRLPVDLERVDVSPDGKSLVSISAQGAAQLWDLATLEEQPVFKDLGTNNIAAFWSGPQEILLGSADPPRIRIWNPVNGTLDDFPLEAVAGKGRLAFAFRPVHRLLVAALAEAGSTNLIVKRWDAATRRELSSVVIAGGIGTNSTPDALKDFSNRLSPDGKWLAKTKFFGAALKIHSLVTGPADKLLDTPQMIQGLALFSEGKAAALASNQKTEVKLRKVATGETIATLKGHNLPLLSIVLSPDEDRLATASIGQESVKLWDTKSWQEVADLDPGPGKFLWDPQFLSDGHTLAIRETDFDGSKWIRLWRAPSWDEIHAVEAKEAKRKSTGPHESR